MFEFFDRRPETTYPLSTTEKNLHRNEAYFLRVVMSDWEGRVRGYPYREFAIQGNQTLYDLAKTVLEYFDFDSHQIYGVYNNIKHGFYSHRGYRLALEEDFNQSTQNLIVAQVFNKPKKKMLFLLNDGKEWHFVIQLKSVKKVEINVKYPMLLKSVGQVLEKYPYRFEAYEDKEVLSFFS